MTSNKYRASPGDDGNGPKFHYTNEILKIFPHCIISNLPNSNSCKRWMLTNAK